MFAIIAGIVFIILGILLWLGNITVARALAVFIGVIGVMFLAWWGAPTAWGRRA